MKETTNRKTLINKMKLQADELKNAQAETLSFSCYEENREIN